MRKLSKFIKFWLNKAIFGLFIVIFALNGHINGTMAAWSFNDVMTLINSADNGVYDYFLITGGDSLLSVNTPEAPKALRVTLTAYSSTPDQTDDTPFITASGTHVRDGIIAANFLDFGTKVQIPEIFGDKVFTVEDRMARKHDGKIDIWFSERYLAKRFGIQEAEVIVLQ